MKKMKLKALAILGLSSTALLSAGTNTAPSIHSLIAQTNGKQMNAASMTPDEQAFCNKLNLKSKMMFKEMDHSGRNMAMNMPENSCKGQNACKGQGNCKTDKHSCKGQNSCKGKGGCKVDANKAVESTAMKMAQKRSAY